METQTEYTVKILPRMSRGGFNIWKIFQRASVCCVFDLASTKDTFIRFLGSLSKKGLHRREWGWKSVTVLIFIFCIYLQTISLPFSPPSLKFTDSIWKVHPFKSLPARRWIVSKAQRWCVAEILRMLPSAEVPKRSPAAEFWFWIATFLQHLRRNTGCARQRDFLFSVTRLRKIWLCLVGGIY